MPELRDRTRARDIDRVNAQWLLDTAYAEGQLGASEYHDRRDAAGAAATLGDLRDLTSDIRLSPASMLEHPIGSRVRVLPLVAAAAALAVVAVVVAVVVGTRGGTDAADPVPEVVAAATSGSDASGSDASGSDVPGSDVPLPDGPIDPFTGSGIASAVAVYDHLFGGTAASELVLYPDRVRMAGPATASGLVDVHELGADGTSASLGTEAGRSGTVDLALLDPEGVARLVADAPTLVGAPAGAVDHVLVVASSTRDTATVYVTADGRSAGYVVAGTDGSGAQVIRAK